VKVHQRLQLGIRDIAPEALQQRPASRRPPDFAVGYDLLPGARGTQGQRLTISTQCPNGGNGDRNLFGLGDIAAN
jgi:hypothetical protein